MKRRGSDAIDWSGMPGDDGRIRVELPDPLQIHYLRRMTPAQRVVAAFGTTKLVRGMIMANLRSTNPGYSDEQVLGCLHRRYHG